VPVDHRALVDEHDEQRDGGARVAARDEAERLVRERDHEDGGERDRDGDVDDRDHEVAPRALLHAVEPDGRLVDQADQQAEAGEQPERLLAVPEQVRRRDRGGERRDRGDDHARDGGGGERGADDRGPGLPLALEREAEERVDQAELRDRDPDGDERGQRLDPAVVVRLQVVRVERQQEQRGEAGDDRPEPVDQRLPAEAQESPCEARLQRRGLHA
jgi:hypothetical protein